MARGNSRSIFRKIDKRNFAQFCHSIFRSSRWYQNKSAIDTYNKQRHDIPHAGTSGLAETGMPRYGWSVASSGAANPSAAGSRQEALPEVLGHKPVNYRVYTTAMPNTGLKERRIESRRQLDRGWWSRSGWAAVANIFKKVHVKRT